MNIGTMVKGSTTIFLSKLSQLLSNQLSNPLNNVNALKFNIISTKLSGKVSKEKVLLGISTY
jgi:hypothetical protein